MLRVQEELFYISTGTFTLLGVQPLLGTGHLKKKLFTCLKGLLIYRC